MHGKYKPPGWRDHDWRFIREQPQDPALHMAVDEVLAREVAAGRVAPTLARTKFASSDWTTRVP